MPPTIADYNRAVLNDLKTEVESTADNRVNGIEPEQWIAQLVQKWGMREILLDQSRDVEMIEVESERQLSAYDIYSDQGPGTVVRSTQVKVQVPVVPSDTIQAIWSHELSPNAFSHATAYPEFDYDHARGYFSDLAEPVAAEVKSVVDRIKTSIRAYNESINSEAQRFQQQVAQGCGSHTGHYWSGRTGQATRTAFLRGRSVSSTAGPHRSLRASARSWTMC